MRGMVACGVVGAVLVVAAGGLGSEGPGIGRNAALAQRSIDEGRPSVEGSLIAFSSQAGENRQQLTVVDPKARVVGVYHVDLATGEIALKSVRSLHWDLQMQAWNSESPLPQEIRSMLEAQ